jgi:hypothetical protein
MGMTLAAHGALATVHPAATVAHSRPEAGPTHSPGVGAAAWGRGDVQAIVLSAAILQYLAAQPENQKLQVVGPIFRPYKITFAIREGSPLRKRINEALLAIYEDGTYEGLSGDTLDSANVRPLHGTPRS